MVEPAPAPTLHDPASQHLHLSAKMDAVPANSAAGPKEGCRPPMPDPQRRLQIRSSLGLNTDVVSQEPSRMLSAAWAEELDEERPEGVEGSDCRLTWMQKYGSTCRSTAWSPFVTVVNGCLFLHGPFILHGIVAEGLGSPSGRMVSERDSLWGPTKTLRNCTGT